MTTLRDDDGVSPGFARHVASTPTASVPLVVGLVHEALERREATVEDELEVAELALVEADVEKRVTLGEKGRLDGRIADVEVLEDCGAFLAVGSVGLCATPRGQHFVAKADAGSPRMVKDERLTMFEKESGGEWV